MSNLTDASRELFKRQPDECFSSLTALWEHCQRQKEACVDRWVAPRSIRTNPHDAGRLLLAAGDDGAFEMNDWSFGQLCRLAGVAKETVNRLVPDTADAEVTEVRFNRPEDFDLEEHLANSFGVFHGDGQVHVKIRFAPIVARYVQESKWHASQELALQKDGTVVAEFDLSDTEEIKRWVMSFGRHAVVEQPDELRKEILVELETLEETYKYKDLSEKPEAV